MFGRFLRFIRFYVFDANFYLISLPLPLTWPRYRWLVSNRSLAQSVRSLFLSFNLVKRKSSSAEVLIILINYMNLLSPLRSIKIYMFN